MHKQNIIRYLFRIIIFLFCKINGAGRRLVSFSNLCLQKFRSILFNNSHIPWDIGYLEERNQYILLNLSSQNIEKFFKNNRMDTYGKGFDERTIELPWFYYNLSKNYNGVKFHLLDAGSACNHGFYLPFLKKFANITIQTLAPEDFCAYNLGISYVYGDLRNTIYKNDNFDAIVSISTLEHIGMDNSSHSPEYNENKTNDILNCILEIKRILKKMVYFTSLFPLGNIKTIRLSNNLMQHY